MHSFPFLTCVACVLAERSRSASLVPGYSCSRWLLLPAQPPSSNHRTGCQARPSPRACAAPRPIVVSIEC
eukprot:5225836-Pleurochrysis_carterae.AAC.3